MERNVISWTTDNWITVCLMVFVMFAVAGVIGKLAHKVSGKSDA